MAFSPPAGYSEFAVEWWIQYTDFKIALFQGFFLKILDNMPINEIYYDYATPCFLAGTWPLLEWLLFFMENSL